MDPDSMDLDPLKINYKQQTRSLISLLPSDSPHITTLQNASTKAELLQILSGLLAQPGLTMTIETLFRPLLVDLCARWLYDEGSKEDRLEALCLLLEIHPEIFPILSAFLKQTELRSGLLHFVNSTEDIANIPSSYLHRVLLAYYRILRASEELPRHLQWSLEPLSKLIWTPHPDNGVRFLAIRCYALHSGMMEGERAKMEKDLIGDVAEAECLLEYDYELDGTRKMVDGWLLPLEDAERVINARNAHLEPQDYFKIEEEDPVEPIHPAELSHNIVNIHGILMFVPSNSPKIDSGLIETPTSIESLRMLANHISLSVPTLITSSPSAGKSLLVTHLASILYPDVHNQIVTIHLADTSLDPRSLLGSHVSSTTRPGTFEWKAGVLVRAMREGKWVVFEDIDRGSNEVLGMLKPLVESLRIDRWIGGRAAMEVPGQGRVVAHENFALFATRSVTPLRNGQFPQAHFFAAHKWHEVIIQAPTHDDLKMIIDAKFPRLAGVPNEGLIRMWEAVKSLGSAASTREIGLRELNKLCTRVQNLLPSSFQPMDIDMEDDTQQLLLTTAFTNITLREDIYFETRDVFFGAGATTAAARAHLDTIATLVAEHLALTPERRDWVLHSKVPEFQPEKNANGQITAVRLGRTRLVAGPPEDGLTTARPFAMHKPAVLLMSRLATAVSLNEPVLLTGETGTGKTSVVTHLASLLRKPLISLNLSHQTESADIIGGFKPVDARVPASELQTRFLDLFGGTFSRKRNAKFEESVRKAVQEGKWKRSVALWLEAAKMAKDRIQAKVAEDISQPVTREGETPRKRRKTDHGVLNVSEAVWDSFENDVRTFDIQHVQGNGKFAFDFVEGPLVKALRFGHWILLDEVNLASAETLECVSSLLHGPTASITLTEQGSLEPVKRHPDFRLFACMNPATDVGKKDLPPNIRSRFSEIDVPPPDADQETLLSIVGHYIGPYAVGDKGAIMDVAEFYTSVRRLAEQREIADGSNHKPHFSMRTLARALTFASDIASAYSLRRALWEGCLMAFTMVLDKPSAAIVTSLAQKHILSNVRNVRSLLSKDPSPPKHLESFIKFGPFYLERGPLPEDAMEDYIMTPSVETKLVDLARIIVTRRFPVLIEGPTSAGKTSSIEYLARRTGHRFIRINNHEHTDIQEYIGTYVSDSATGKLVFKDGLLVRALRQGDWIVLDELNLAPTDVLEALNRLLDDNRELVIPETQEVVKPHPHFMLFATQNPPGLYAGRKVLSRAFRNRFLEVHFEDVPQAELETILCQRCRIAPSYGQKIVAVFQELQKRRQTSRIFETKHGFATLRDLFRWAGRDAIDYQELAENGFMLLAERARRAEDKTVVKDIIESIMKVQIDETRLYDLHGSHRNAMEYLGCPVPPSSEIVWTAAMRRLFTLVARAVRFNEPVLLVGETGCGKTSVCQLYAQVLSKQLYTVNCHQNTETADLIGGLRPVRNRATMEADVLREFDVLLPHVGEVDRIDNVNALLPVLHSLLKRKTLDESLRAELQKLHSKVLRLSSLFQWYDGPLIEAMRKGDVFLMDEISLADDSVLERLNSVLEPSRTVVLAERGDDETDLPIVTADSQFKLVATMNPGGDYGKKELSPALRNRFTEIWVPSVSDRRDLDQIVNSLWKHEHLKAHTHPLLEFADWLSVKVGDRTIISLRDILAWVQFSNAVFGNERSTLSLSDVFHHAAYMTFLDGLGSLPQLSSYSPLAIRSLKDEAIATLHQLLPLDTTSDTVAPASDDTVQLGTFALPRGPKASHPDLFSFQAPTTRDNVSRVVRACQLPKPILLEGSPGVGKTSLVSALANICGYELCRINLSDQTDIIDLFGSDLPVEGEGPGQFAWKDAEFLRAMQEGHWVLLDEMNLAPQAILEGLNAVLDHRGTVYIPELGRSFSRHPSFRIFAAQNPVHQGGGRKGLPKSFLNRFTKVYVQELTSDDILIVSQHLFPDLPVEQLRAMILFTTSLQIETTTKQTFGREGSPWEFNLRDVIRWGSLIRGAPSTTPSQYLPTVFSQRFRNEADRSQAHKLFDNIFSGSDSTLLGIPRPTITPNHIQIGLFHMDRQGFAYSLRSGRLLHSHLQAGESLGLCLTNNWLSILTGPRNSGKSSLLRTMARLSGKVLHEISINAATDANDLLGSFEEVDFHSRMVRLLDSILKTLDTLVASSSGSAIQPLHTFRNLIQRTLVSPSQDLIQHVLEALTDLRPILDTLHGSTPLAALLNDLTNVPSTGRFEWVDGPLVTALKLGNWLVLDDANLCSASVLDRLNALCEIDGHLTLNEKGAIDGQVQIIKPHPDFRLFMCVNPEYGDLSRAMRNRGIEIALLSSQSVLEQSTVVDHLRLPTTFTKKSNQELLHSQYAFIRRGISTQVTLSDRLFPVTFLSGEDSPLDSIIELYPIIPSSPQSRSASLHFVAQAAVQSYLPLLIRFFTATDAQGSVGLLRALSSSRWLAVMKNLRRQWSETSGIPLEVLDAQRNDLGSWYQSLAVVTPSFQYLSIANHLLLRLFVASKTLTESLASSTLIDTPAVVNWQSSKLDEMPRRIKSKASALFRLVVEASQQLLEITHLDISSSERTNILLRLVAFSQYLCQILTMEPLDFSALYVISRWFTDRLRDSEFSTIQAGAIALSETLSLSTGHGISEIWQALYHVQSPDVRAKITSMDQAVRKSSPVLRSSVHELMAMCTLTDKHNIQGLDSLAAQLNLPEVQPTDDTVDSHSLLLLVSELDTLAHILPGTNMPLTEETVSNIHKRLEHGFTSMDSSLSRLIPYTHMVWASKANSPIQPFVANVYRDWYKDLWRSGQVKGIEGPASLCVPAVFSRVTDLCEWEKQTLGSLPEYNVALQQCRRTVASYLGAQRRIELIGTLLIQTIILVTSPFLLESAQEDLTDISNLIETRAHWRTILPRVTCLLTHVKDGIISDTFHQAFPPILEGVLNPDLAEQDTFTRLGLCWITLGQVAIDLFVPNAPIDPAALQRCSQRFHKAEHDEITMQLEMHLHLARRTTGESQNSTTHLLQALLAEVSKHLSSESSVSSVRADVARLHSYWAEVQQLVKQVLSPSKLEGLLNSFKNHDKSAESRERVLQESLAAFSQRLDALYSEYEDINKPIQLSLDFIKFGLRVTCYASSNLYDSTLNDLSLALTSFPSVHGAEQLAIETSNGEGMPSTFSSLVVRLTAILYQTHDISAVDDHICEIETAYEKAFGLWSMDRTRTEEREREAQSLYRQKKSEHDATDEIEAEEAEFRSLFPEFEDILDDSHSSTSKNPTLVVADDIKTFYRIHQLLFSRSQSKQDNTIFDNAKNRFIQDSILPAISSLSEKLDSSSVPFLLGRLGNIIHSFHTVHVGPRPYDFYQDANIPEARKGYLVIQAFIDRLNSLLLDWPDQMVLHHLKSRCEAMLDLRLSSPIARILSTLEQLLLHSEDWEQFANRENTLKNQQQALVSQIVEWRRLELSSWLGILETQSHSFLSGMSEWWFRLYEVIVRGAMNAKDGDDTAMDATEYFDSLVPMLDDFMLSSPLGQYSTRLELLRSMEQFVSKAYRNRSDSHRATLSRVQVILHSTRHYFAQQESKLNTKLSEQRATVEKEIKDFIKLASWRDVNVQALKQTAQKTHRLLYKSIRKFRDILRQPITDIVQSISIDPTRAPFIHHQPRVEPVFGTSDVQFPPRSMNTLCAQHLLDLSKTFRNFKARVTTGVLSLVSSASITPTEELAEDVLSTVSSLSNSSIPTNVDKARRTILLKNLLSRKRKAWSDFMKEMKRAGLSANVKPDILTQQQSLRWLREQPVLTSSPGLASIVGDVEDYFYKLLRIMPEIRGTLSNHHNDLSTRELQRALMFVESCFTFALRSRTRLADTLTNFGRLQNLRSRLRMIHVSQGVASSGQMVLPSISHAKDSAYKLVDVIEELQKHLTRLQDVVEISPSVAEELNSISIGLSKQIERLQGIYDNAHHTHHPVLLQDEVATITETSELFSETLSKLEGWSTSMPRLRQYFEPMQSWLKSKLDFKLSQSSTETSEEAQDYVIDDLLLVIQSLVRIAGESESPDQDQESSTLPDGYIRDGVTRTFTLTSKFNLGNIADVLDSTVEKLSILPHDDVQRSIGRFMPFLEEFMTLAEVQVQGHLGWTRSLLKLDFILANIVRNIAREGFCQPQETEEGDGSEENGQQVDGTGLGEGTGEKNVSKEIEDESQVEGLQGEDEGKDDEDVERAEEGDAVEMSEDIGGKMQDVPDDGEEDGEGDDDEGSEQDLDEQIGDLDASEENAIDEKLWNDEEDGSKDQDDSSKEPGKDDNTQASKESQMAAKTDDQNKSSDTNNDKQEAPPDSQAEEEEAEAVGEEEAPEEAGPEGAPIDEHLKNTEILDLPDDLDIDMDKDQQEMKLDDDDIDEDMGDEEDPADDSMPQDSGDQPDDEMDVDANQDDPSKVEDTTDVNAEQPEQENPQDNQQDSAIAQADIHGGDGTGDSNVSTADATNNALPESKQSEGSQGQSGQIAGPSERSEQEPQEQIGEDGTGQSEQEQQPQTGPLEQADDATASGTQRSIAGSSSQTSIPRLSSNPIRSLGDAMKEIRQRFDEILENERSSDHKEQQMDASKPGQLEYIQEDETQSDMQALGPAGQDEVARLNDLKIADEETEDDANFAMDEDQIPTDPDAQHSSERQVKEEASGESHNAPKDGVAGALIPSDVRSQLGSSDTDATGPPVPSTEVKGEREEQDHQDAVEVQVRQWQAQGYPSTEAERIWRLYESLTHDLSYALCEQLRLILEPTMATRLKGDYRTGKRLNMKKIIPYIASEYTKDKIWLRRTRPSQREYQVLVALDDSRSMSESHSVHLAYQTLALVSKALSRLEVGDIGIAKFGESVEILHGFDQGPFTDQAGTKIMDAFKFNQKATQVLSLVERSLSLLEEARERRSSSSSSAGDLWQMEIIISDGICQDHDRLRTILRKAEEQRVMVVFIILDSLHGVPAGGDSAAHQAQNSILSMNQVGYKEVDGRMDLTVTRYLDSFPFEYYVVVRDVEALPDVLAGTLKQFFERISED